MTGTLDGRVAIVTGAGSGIGRSCAIALAREGAQVVVSDIVAEGGNETVRLIQQVQREATFVQCDVSKPREIEALFAEVEEKYGRLDCAVNNAGIGGVQQPTAAYPLESWQKVLDINLTAPWLCMKYEITQMLKHGRGSIVNMASILGVTGTAYSGAYVAAKHGLIGATQTAALEYSKQGIRINAVCPGYIETPLLTNAGLSSEVMQSLVTLHPIGRLGKPEEVAELVLWLCSDAASFVTGTAMLVDGGYTAQ